jgi:long-chain acyl-CoA synthetase
MRLPYFGRGGRKAWGRRCEAQGTRCEAQERKEPRTMTDDTFEQWPNLVRMFFDQAEHFGERPLLWRKLSGQYRPVTWRETAQRTCALARGLRRQGLQEGDRVVLVSENRPAWLIADLAIMAAGGITVPAYTTNTADDHLHILSDSGASAIIVSSRRLAEPLVAAARNAGGVRFLISLEPLDPDPGDGIERLAWDDVIARNAKDHTNVVAGVDTMASSQTACIIYTSGTGGAPKGVMLSHRAILHNCQAAAEVVAEIGTDMVFLSLLPLSHAYEHTAGQFLPIALGAEIYYAEGIEKLALNIREARPTVITAVPRFYELMHDRVRKEIDKTGGLKARLFFDALSLGSRRIEDPRGIGLVDRLYDRLLDHLVRKRFRERFGGRLKGFVAGGAAMKPQVGLFFTALGLPVYQGYGQTEAAPLISVNRKDSLKMHTVGPPIRGVDVRIAGDGEILVRGPLLMTGYWRNEDATAETIRDGWLHTGDIGEIDADGHLRIVDRKKDMIVNSGGDNIAPSRIEAMLGSRPEVGQCLVFGDGRPHLVALVVPDEEWLRQWAGERGKDADLASLSGDPALHEALRPAVDAVNEQLSVVERIRRFAVASQPFSQDNNQLTPTMKVRRHAVAGAYGESLERLYR